MLRVVAALCILFCSGGATVAAQDPWAVLREGRAVALMRHGGAVLAEPGTAPPVPGCEPTAVLTEIGREEMRRLGERMRFEGVPGARIFVSRQCSAWETAKLLGLGRVEHDPALDPPARTERGDARRDALERALLAAAREPGEAPVILVTHRLNIAAITGIEVTQGEVLLLRPLPGGGLTLVGRIAAD
jgi:broad specificity phosphatase PhoE